MFRKMYSPAEYSARTLSSEQLGNLNSKLVLKVNNNRTNTFRNKHPDKTTFIEQQSSSSNSKIKPVVKLWKYTSVDIFGIIGN